MAATKVINGVHYELKYDQITGHFEWIPASNRTLTVPASEWKVGDRFRFRDHVRVPVTYQGRIGRVTEIGLVENTAFRFELEDGNQPIFGRTVWYKTAAEACERLPSIPMHTGPVTCRACGTYNEYAVPNQSDGVTFVCWGCSHVG